jgi:hypothetical protein
MMSARRAEAAHQLMREAGERFDQKAYVPRPPASTPTRKVTQSLFNPLTPVLTSTATSRSGRS